MPNAQVFDLLEARTFQALLRQPSLIEESTVPEQAVVIDEIQRLPSLLDEVHRLIEKRGQRFLLTGSSARKLRLGGANLLAGRAWRADLFPFTSIEIPDFDLLRYLNFGGLPGIYLGTEPDEDLSAYVGTYLSEEIKAEAVTRNIQAFSQFLEMAGLSNGCEIVYESMASDCGVSAGTLKSYIGILEDTLVGFTLPGYTKSSIRKATSRSKFYFFDLGVARHLGKRSHIQEGSKEFGDAFEHFIVAEIRAYLSYSRKKIVMSYWRSQSQFEVDIVLEDRVAIEVKSTQLASQKHLKGLRALKEEKLQQAYILVSLDPISRKTDDGIQIFPWKIFLKNLWDGKVI
jgi:uncharacterized protein